MVFGKSFFCVGCFEIILSPNKCVVKTKLRFFERIRASVCSNGKA